MTLSEARRVWGDLMRKARGGTLTERDRVQLTTARQTMRRAKRPAMNKRNPIELGYRSKKTGRGRHLSIGVSRSQANPEKTPEERIELLSTYPRKELLRMLHRLGITAPEIKDNRELAKLLVINIDSAKRRTQRNPSRSLQRIGRAVEVRYRRDIGSKPGYYKHEIESPRAGVYTVPAGWVYVGSKSILITESKPHV